MTRSWLWIGVLLASTAWGAEGPWKVVHEIEDGKIKNCGTRKWGQPSSYTALVYRDEYKEIVCEDPKGSDYTVQRMKAIAQLFNDLDRNRPITKFSDEGWIPE
jgi:hypothetical protein